MLKFTFLSQLLSFRKDKVNVSNTFKRRQGLDRRRLEEAFFVYASLDVMRRHGFEIDHFPYEKSELAKKVATVLHTSFISKWGGK